MGITIAYRGRLADFERIEDFEDRLVDCALEAPADLRFGVYYGVSRNTWRFWDISNEIGYDPQDDAEQHRT